MTLHVHSHVHQLKSKPLSCINLTPFGNLERSKQKQRSTGFPWDIHSTMKSVFSIFFLHIINTNRSYKDSQNRSTIIMPDLVFTKNTT